MTPFARCSAASRRPSTTSCTTRSPRASGHLALVHRAFAGERITTTRRFPYDARELRQVSVPEGHPCTVVASFFPLRAADGHVAFVAIAFKDVTPEHAARELPRPACAAPRRPSAATSCWRGSAR
jgi:hypothetical protein